MYLVLQENVSKYTIEILLQSRLLPIATDFFSSRVDTARSFAKSPRRRWDQTELCDIGQDLRMHGIVTGGFAATRGVISQGRRMVPVRRPRNY